MSDEDPDVGEEISFKVGGGRLKVKMRIDEHIPQYLPINGRKVKVHYRGIPKMCTNCYQDGHIKFECPNEQVTWIEYVATFIESNPDIPEQLYGRWLDIARRWRIENLNVSTSTVKEIPPTRDLFFLNQMSH